MVRHPIHRGRALRIVALVTVALGGAGARPASAQVDRVPLAWDAPPGCPTADMVLADVKRTLGESSDGRAPFIAAVSVRAPVGGLWQASLRIETRGGRTERQFEAESCEAIASAAALIVALSAEGAGGAAPTPAPREVPAVAASPQPGGALPGDHWRPAQLVAMVNAIADGGTMPNGPARGIELATGVSWTIPFWRLRALSGAGLFPTRRATGLGQSGDVSLLTVSGRGCLTATPAVFEMGFCLGAELAAMRVTNVLGEDMGGFRSFAVNDATQFWLSPLIAAVAAWNISPRIGVFGKAEVAVPSTQRTFLAVVPTQGSDPLLQEIYVVPAVATRAAVGIEVRFY